MFVHVRQPKPPLDQYVGQLVYYTDYDPDYKGVFMLPNGTVELLIPLDEMSRTFYVGASYDDLISCRRAILTGMQKRPVYTQSDSGATMVAVSFKGGRSFPFLHLPLVEFNNLYVEAEQIFGRSILFLREQLGQQSEPDKILTLVEQYLLARFRPMTYEARLIDHTLTQLMQQTIPLETIAAEVGYSHKQLIHIFKKHVGPTPKTYQRIFRFNHALQQMHAAEQIDWTDLSYSGGFYDQAHFINEFKKFAGITPESYLQRREAYPHFVPVYHDIPIATVLER